LKVIEQFLSSFEGAMNTSTGERPGVLVLRGAGYEREETPSSRPARIDHPTQPS
jgi:hypothetical protein